MPEFSCAIYLEEEADTPEQAALSVMKWLKDNWNQVIVDVRDEDGSLTFVHMQEVEDSTDKKAQFVAADSLRAAILEMVRRKTGHRDMETMLSKQWWKYQHIIDGLKLALGQVSAVARGRGAKPPEVLDVSD